MASTITRDRLLSLMEEQGGPPAAALVKDLLAQGSWANKQEFTQADVVYVLEAVAEHARQTFAGPNSPAPVHDGTRDHALGLIDALQQHALPLLHREVDRQ